MSRITQELKLETKENIIEAATKLFSEQGFDKTKTKTIAQLCGIAEGTLFNYFSTKDDLLIAVFEHMAQNETQASTKQLPQPVDVLLSTTIAPIKSMHRMPKALLLDLLISSVKIAKRKPRLFQRLVAIDFNYIEKLKQKLDLYADFHDHSIQSQDLAEMVYGVVAADFLIYLYDKDKTYDQFECSVTPKLKALFKPYIKEVMIHDQND